MTNETTLRTERRRHPRHTIIRDCKLRNVASTAFTPAWTTDLSLGGALLCLSNKRPYATGDRLEIALPHDERTPLVSSDDLVPARVRRVVPIDRHHVAVGVEFDHELPVALAQAA